MNNYVIITDSTSDLNKELIDKINVEILPLRYIVGDDQYWNEPEEGDANIKEFYSKLRNGASSSTSQITFASFKVSFKKYLDKDLDILYIAFSSGLSGTAHQAVLAKNELAEEYPNRKIIVVDSLAASLGEGMLVYYAANLKNEGKSMEEVAEFIENNKLKLAHWFTVDDLNFLKRGGRVSPAAALLGSVLGIKPILHVDDEGHLIPVGKVRGRKASIEELVIRASKTIENPENQTAFICHGDCIDDAEYLAKRAKEVLGVKEVIIGYTGPVIGSHSGPGTLALFTFNKNRN